MLRISATIALGLLLACGLPVPSFAGPVETRLAEELTATLGEAVPRNAEVSLALTVPFDGPVDAVRDLSYDPRTGGVRALVDSGGAIREIFARAAISVQVPVPTRRIGAGEIIAEADLTTVSMPVDRLGDGIMLDAEALVGLQSRRLLPPGRLIQQRSVGAPLMVKRNKPVTLVFSDGALQLAAGGRALQDGGVGDQVRVMNTASGSVVTGTVSAHETVTVGGAEPLSATTASR